MKKLIITSFIFCLSVALFAQPEYFEFNAGPDITICSTSGKMIGDTINSANSLYCYRWEPAEGLSNPDDARPIATPTKTTTYTLTVLKNEWERIYTDQVTVHVGWGPIKFDPPYLFQSGDSKIKASLLNNEFGGTPDWEIMGDKLDCQVLPPSLTEIATIKDGNKYGKITVRCTNLTPEPGEECYTEETLEINPGVKDVHAIDFDNPERIAKNGESLVLVGTAATDNTTVRIKAVPNEGSFPAGYPKWYPSINAPLITTVPTDGEHIFLRTESYDEEFVAGPGPGMGGPGSNNSPRVYVNRVSPSKLQVNLGELLITLKSFFTSVTKTVEKVSKCGGIATDITGTELKYSRELVEKFASPDSARKEVLTFSPGIGFTGKLCYCPLTQDWKWPWESEPFISTELCASAGVGFSLEGGIEYDPSTSKNPEWEIIKKLKAAGKMEFGVNGGITLALPGDYTATGEVKSSISPTLEFVFNNDTKHITAQFVLPPVPVSVNFVVQSRTRLDRKITLADYSIDLIEGISSPPFILYTFQN